jgi:hypothetical protein
VPDHPHRDQHHQDEIDCLRRKHMGRSHVIHGVRDEEGQSPAPSNTRTCKDLVLLAAFQQKAADKERYAHRKSDDRFA